MSDHSDHRAPEWLAALIHAPAGGVVTSADPPPGAEHPEVAHPRIVVGTAVDMSPGPTRPAAPERQPEPERPRVTIGMAVEEGAAPADAAEAAGAAEARGAVDEAEGGVLRALPVAAIRPHPGQPRRSMDETELQALADSIAEQGVIQPIVVRPVADAAETYEIVAGERRWRAARMTGLSMIPALVRPLADALLAEVALVENVQRADLPPLDEALAYQQLIEAHGRTQDEVARRLGKSRSHVAHMLRLLRLPGEVQDLIRDGSISVGHAQVLVNAADPGALARRIVAEGLTVRQAEEAAKTARQEPAPKRPQAAPPAAVSDAWAERFGAALARPVAVKPGKRGGSLVIPYDSDDDLASILARISH